MVKSLRTFNLDDDVIDMLRKKKKNQSRYVNELLRTRLFADPTKQRRFLDETEPQILASMLTGHTRNPLILNALYELISEIRAKK
jgi:hypothetical protein